MEEDGAFPGFPWPPRVGDYVHVNATGDTARVVGIPDYGAGRRFTIEVLPRQGERYDPDRLVRRTCTLDKLSPESPPEHDPS